MTKNSREQRNAARRKKYAIKTRKDKIMKEAKKSFRTLQVIDIVLVKAGQGKLKGNNLLGKYVQMRRFRLDRKKQEVRLNLILMFPIKSKTTGEFNCILSITIFHTSYM
jgi:hypothetical protein